MKEELQPTAAAELLNDPNCKITINDTGSIQNAGNGSDQNRQDAQSAIAQLSFPDIWRTPLFRITSGTVELRVDGVTADGGRIWSVVISDMNSNNVLAYTQVQGNLATASTSDRQAYVQQMVCRALAQSLQTGRNTDVAGPCR